MAVIANFGIRFGVDASDVEAGLAKVKTSVSGMGANLATVGAAIAQSIDFSAIGAAAKQAVDTASHIADMAQRVGITAEAVQRLQFAAEQSGGSFEAVATAMRVMSDRIVDDKLPQALEDMGLSMLQLSGLSMDEAFLTVADAVGNIEDPMLRSATAVDIFGRGAQALMPAIVNGFRDVANEAPTMSNALVGAADDIGDEWAELQLRMENLKAEALIPVVDLFMKLPTPVLTAGSAFSEILPTISNFSLAAASLPLAAQSIKGLWLALAPFAAPTAIITGIGAVGLALADLARQEVAKGSEIGNLVSRSLGAGDLRPGLRGPKRTGDIALPGALPGDDGGGMISGAGIGNLLDPKKTQAAARATNEAAEALKRLNREADALESWARNEQGMSQFKADAEAVKKAAEVQRAAMFGMPQTAGMQSQDASALQSSMSNIGAAMQAIPAAMQSQGVSSLVPAGMTMGQQLMAGMSGSFAMLPQTILTAFQGGGNPMASIFSSLGGTIGSTLSVSIGKALSGTLGKTLGGAIGGIMGPLGAMLGPLISDLAAKLGKKIWQGLQGVFGTDEEARDVNPARDAFLAKFGGAGTGVDSGFGKLAAQLTAATGEAGGGALFQSLISADTMAEFNAATKAIEDRLKGLGSSFADVGAQVGAAFAPNPLVQQNVLASAQKELDAARASGAAPELIDQLQARVDAYSATTGAIGGTTTATAGLTDATGGLNIALHGSDEAIAALGSTQERVVSTMLAGFDALILKLGEFIAAMGTIGSVGPPSMPAVGAGEAGVAPMDPGAAGGEGIAPWTGDPNSPWGTGNWESDLPPAFPSFANEGMVSSPTLAMLHGSLSDPEFVLRKSTVEGLASGGRGGVTVQLNVSVDTVIGEDAWVRNNLTPKLMDAIQGNAQGAFSKLEALVKQAMGPTAIVPGLP